MTAYVDESFTSLECDILRRYFTNLDQPVFALVNLPEVVKGALFARYSRSSKSLRRLFLDEFVDDLDLKGDETVDATVGLHRAEDLYERVFVEYGDDSVAQLGGVHLACEYASNVLTKILEWGRLMAYLEQSTRYVAYDSRLPSGHYRYHRDPEILSSPYGALYVGEMDRMFDTYAALLPQMQSFLLRRYPRQIADTELLHRQAIRAKALDSLRGLLPAGSLANVGMYGTGQSYELLVMKLRRHPLPEARLYGDMILAELRKVIPSFLSRIDRPDRGIAWSDYLANTKVSAQEAARAVEMNHGLGPQPNCAQSSVKLLDWDVRGEDKVLAAILFEFSHRSEEELLDVVAAMSSEERRDLIRAYAGTRINRRHRPGRAFERTSYRFEVVTDYGAFRDLQRHRMLTLQWQALDPHLGYELPALVEEAGFSGQYRESMERSEELYWSLAASMPDHAGYAVALGYRVRCVLQMNAREAMHVIELRSQPQGHQSYRYVAQQMHRLISEQADHQMIADAMGFVDYSSVELERLAEQRRTQSRQSGI